MRSRSRSRSYSPARGEAYSPLSPREEANGSRGYDDRGGEKEPARYRDYSRSPSRSPGYSRSPSYSRSRSRSRSISRSRSRSRSRSFSRSVSRSRSRSISRGRSFSRSPGPRNGGRFGRGRSPRSRSRSRSPGPRRGREPSPGGPPKPARPLIIVYGITDSVNRDHLREIFGQYGEIGRITIGKHWARIRSSKQTRGVFVAMLDFEQVADAQKA
ncbi:hypothetical protein GGI11_007373, partial [Coemansia sp. RSA 2049]